jgi:hypothetical protein
MRLNNTGSIALTCHFCGTPFRRSPSNVGRFCSYSCSNKGTKQPIEQRFWSKVLKGDGCWPWMRARYPTGYGLFVVEGKDRPASRVAWELTHGPIPDGLSVCHHCDNPPCVRPDHLFLGTTADNMADMVAKGRNARGEKSRLAKLTEADVRAIRSRAASGVSSRVLATEFGVCMSNIWLIKTRRHWSHVP